MRMLVGITCIAVFSAVGYYFWKESSEHQAAVSAANEVVLDRQFCIGEAKRALADLRNQTYLALCKEKGLVTDADISKLITDQDVY